MAEASSLRTWFELVVAKPESERDAAARALVPDEATYRQLMALVRADGGASSEDDVQDSLPSGRAHPWPGDPVGAYRLIAPIGEGGMGSVWLAVARGASEVRVAVKFAIPQTVDRDEARGRLEQERRVLTALCHPGIVSVVDAGTAPYGVPYLVLPALEGVPLDAHLRERAPDLAGCVRTLAGVARALAHAHERGIVHRDIKPANLMVSADGAATVIDFGGARISDEAAIEPVHLTQGASPRTPGFASPEQERGERATPASDLFALGVVARAALTACSGPAGIPRELAQVVERACHSDPAHRPASAAAFAASLERASAHVSRAARPGWRGLASLGLAFAAGTLVFGVPFARRAGSDADTGSAASQWVEATLLGSLRDAPSHEVPIEASEIARIGEETGDPSWSALGAFRYAIDGALDDGTEPALVAIHGVSELPWIRRVELADACERLGLPAHSVSAVDGLVVPGGSEFQHFEIDVVNALARSRMGTRVPIAELLELSGRMDDASEGSIDDLHEGADGFHERLFLLRLATGEPAALDVVLEGIDASGIWYEPLEAPTAAIDGLLALYSSLWLAGVAHPLEGDTLARMEGELVLRIEEGLSVARPLARTRMLRIALALTEGRDATGLAREGYRSLIAAEQMPADVRIRLRSVAIAVLGAGGRGDRAEDVTAPAADTFPDVSEALGPAAPLTRAVAGRDLRGLSPEEVLSVVRAALEDQAFAGDPEATAERIDRAAREQAAPPWWWRTDRSGD